MADSKISALTAITTLTPATDVLPVVDVTGTTKKITTNQILGSGGTATLASATITGDMTVRTNKLAVTSTGVGIGTATPAAGAALSVLGTTSVSASDYTVSSTWASRFQAAANNQPSGILLSGLTSGGSVVPGSLHVEPVANSSRSALIATYAADSAVGYFAINRFSPSAATTSQHFKIDDTGVATWSNVGGVAGTAMTLNSTGLGVGVAPNRNLDIRQDQSAATIARVQNQSVNAAAYSQVNLSASGNNWGILVGSSAANSNRLEFVVDPSGTNLSVMRLDTSGNVGIGVTPSAWGAGGNIQGTNGFIWSSYDASVGAGYYYASGSYKYISTAAASIYQPFAGTHKWFTAAGGQPAGTNFTPTQAMTLDASGNLLVGTTSTATSSGNGFKVLQTTSGHFDPTVITAQNSGIYSCWDIYSTGGTAGYRFYVTSTGTINAVNTTISAISDARLKENVQDIDVGLGAILALKPRKFDWKEGKGKNIKGDRGFIAQEFEQVFPQLVDEWKDPAPEGEAPYKSVRQDLIPVLVKAIQELTARVQTLEAK